MKTWWAFIEIKRTICWDDLEKPYGKDIVVVQTVPNLEVNCKPNIVSQFFVTLKAFAYMGSVIGGGSTGIESGWLVEVSVLLLNNQLALSEPLRLQNAAA